MASTDSTHDNDPGSSSRKRKAPADAAANLRRVVKTRASKACHSCRARKVRCDVLKNGSPCTNCRLDAVECIVTESRRNRRSSTTHAASQALSTPPFSDGEELPLCLTFDDEYSLQHSNSPVEKLGFHSLHSAGLERVSSWTSTARPFLPRYIRPLRQDVPDDDVDFLILKGAFEIPNRVVRDELLRCYAQHVHPLMPHLDLTLFLESIHLDGAGERVSLLVLQAVLFAGVASVGGQFLQSLGFRNRRAARKAFFQRVRLLYDFDVETESTAILQALLLMTLWYDSPRDEKHTWHWMGLSVSLANTMGLHRSPENSSLPLQDQRLRKRLWWSCFVRDRLIGLGTRRPIRIRSEECDVPPLTLDDLSTPPLSHSAETYFANLPEVTDPITTLQLKSTFIELTRLCVCLSHVLTSQYSVLSHKVGSNTDASMMIVPRRSAKQAHEVSRCDDELIEWFGNRAPASQFGDVQRVVDLTKPIHFHKAALLMIYLTTVSALHRPQVCRTMSGSADASSPHQLSRLRLCEAATEITTIGRRMLSTDTVRFLPTSGVPIFLSAILTHLMNIKSDITKQQNTSMLGFYMCMQILHRLREVYASADSAVLFLAAAIRKADMHILLRKSDAQSYVPREGSLCSNYPSKIDHNASMISNETHQPADTGFTDSDAFYGPEISLSTDWSKCSSPLMTTDDFRGRLCQPWDETGFQRQNNDIYFHPSRVVEYASQASDIDAGVMNLRDTSEFQNMMPYPNPEHDWMAQLPQSPSYETFSIEPAQQC